MSTQPQSGRLLLLALQQAAKASSCFACGNPGPMESAAIFTPQPARQVHAGRFLVYGSCAQCDEDRRRDAPAYLAAIERRFVALGELKP